jgi:hypothetical protein
MEDIKLQEWCELRLFMIADGSYTSKQIRDELSKYVIIDKKKPMLNGDMANEFNDTHY